MNLRLKRIAIIAVFFTVTISVALAETPAGNGFNPGQPTWLTKFKVLSGQNPITVYPTTNIIATSVGSNIDVSNETGPQSETSIAINPKDPTKLVAGSNEINRPPMRGYFSSDGGTTWSGVDLPLPKGKNFGSDPGVAWDTRGNVYYSYIVVFYNPVFGVTGSEMAVARSADGGKTWTSTYFALQNLLKGATVFNDKPMITVDNNPSSSHLGTIYVSWDIVDVNTGLGKGVLVSHSTDGGKTFSSPVLASTTSLSGIGADPFVAPDGTLHVAWHDFNTKVLSEASSNNGGLTFGHTHAITTTNVASSILIPADNSRGVLIYPACGADTSSGPNKGNLYCSWTDSTASNGLDIFVSNSTDGGITWNSPVRVNDDPTGVANDQFFNWLSVDPTDGSIHLSFYDTRNDPTHNSTDVFYSKSTDGSNKFSANIKVTTATTDETCCGADLGNQYGDYEGIAAFGGAVHPVWTDRRASVIAQGLGEEVFTAAIQ